MCSVPKSSAAIAILVFFVIAIVVTIVVTIVVLILILIVRLGLDSLHLIIIIFILLIIVTSLPALINPILPQLPSSFEMQPSTMTSRVSKSVRATMAGYVLRDHHPRDACPVRMLATSIHLNGLLQKMNLRNKRLGQEKKL